MSPDAIKEQLQTLDKAISRAIKSKESARAFLISAGLIPHHLNTAKPKVKTEKTN